MSNLLIRHFEPDDQDAVCNLILAGLGDRFDVLDPLFNPDLDNIWENYIAQGDCFLVIVEGKRIVGTGALIIEEDGTGRIVRMSVAADMRRQGIGRLLVGELLAEGVKRGYSRIVVETNDDWDSAIRLYKECGFRPYDHRDGEIQMQLELEGYGSKRDTESTE